jgi:hypothetical protein
VCLLLNIRLERRISTKHRGIWLHAVAAPKESLRAILREGLLHELRSLTVQLLLLIVMLHHESLLVRVDLARICHVSVVLRTVQHHTADLNLA